MITSAGVIFKHLDRAVTEITLRGQCRLIAETVAPLQAVGRFVIEEFDRPNGNPRWRFRDRVTGWSFVYVPAGAPHENCACLTCVNYTWYVGMDILTGTHICHWAANLLSGVYPLTPRNRYGLLVDTRPWPKSRRT